MFYGWWDWRFLLLIAISSIADFLIGIQLGKSKHLNSRKLWLVLSLLINLGILAYFKYFNFFIGSFASLLDMIGFEVHMRTLKIILPVGISFYTFQTLSYTIDIFREKLKPTKDWVAFFCYVSFFPQLVAGPIERAGRLLPQFTRARKFNYDEAKDGLRMILWGLFKKVVIADSCAVLADEIFANPNGYPGSVLVLGLIYFAFQIYGDFSGYSDIAIGSAKLMGFRLMKNFKYPFFATNVEDFWRRWHISLTTWLRDYVFVALKIKNGPGYKLAYVRNIFVVFLLVGLWHGANWTFILWSIAYFFLFLIEYGFRMLRKKQVIHYQDNYLLPNVGELMRIGIFFALNLLILTLFRAESLSHAWNIWSNIFDTSLLAIPDISKMRKLIFIIILLVWEWLKRDKWHGLDFDEVPRSLRWVVYIVLIGSILFHFGSERPFIYFQF